MTGLEESGVQAASPTLHVAGEARTGRRYPPECHEPVARPVMDQDWDLLTFLHWRYEPALVQALLPPGLSVELYDGSAWIGLVPFFMRVRVGLLPPVPYATVFPETNVRTYVRGPGGEGGVWFLSLDIPRLYGVLIARATYRVPYQWSQMNVRVRPGHVAYRCQRRWPDARGATSIVTVETGEAIAPSALTELDHFLTARYRVYTVIGRKIMYVPVEHRPWQLARARVAELEDSLVAATGLPLPVGEPLAHYSPHIRAKIGFPRVATPNAL